MTLNCKTPDDVLKAIKDNDIKHVDLRFTDPRGKWQHLTQWHTTIEEDVFEDGFMFDGSSIAGWKAINESDMSLQIDVSTASGRSCSSREASEICNRRFLQLE